MYVVMYVCMDVCMYICMYVYIYVCVYHRNHWSSFLVMWPQLKYLDDKPVFENERRTAEAWYPLLESVLSCPPFHLV